VRALLVVTVGLLSGTVVLGNEEEDADAVEANVEIENAVPIGKLKCTNLCFQRKIRGIFQKEKKKICGGGPYENWYSESPSDCKLPTGSYSITCCDTRSNEGWTGGYVQIEKKAKKLCHKFKWGAKKKCHTEHFSFVIPTPKPTPAPLPARFEVLQCGSSSRDIRKFFPDKQYKRIQTGGACAPSDSYIAVFATRSASQLNLRDYVKNGGIVITEYNSDKPVFDNIFLTNVKRGNSKGGCQDGLNTKHQFNSQDKFWKDNTWTSQGRNGCGFDTGNYPGVTALAGWDANYVSLSYRDLGKGRLWLVSSDWQDGEGYIIKKTEQLMSYMMTHRAGGKKAKR